MNGIHRTYKLEPTQWHNVAEQEVVVTCIEEDQWNRTTDQIYKSENHIEPHQIMY